MLRPYFAPPAADFSDCVTGFFNRNHRRHRIYAVTQDILYHISRGSARLFVNIACRNFAEKLSTFLCSLHNGKI
jgi:hypothetical protein